MPNTQSRKLSHFSAGARGKPAKRLAKIKLQKKNRATTALFFCAYFAALAFPAHFRDRKRLACLRFCCVLFWGCSLCCGVLALALFRLSFLLCLAGGVRWLPCGVRRVLRWRGCCGVGVLRGGRLVLVGLLVAARRFGCLCGGSRSLVLGCVGLLAVLSCCVFSRRRLRVGRRLVARRLCVAFSLRWVLPCRRRSRFGGCEARLPLFFFFLFFLTGGYKMVYTSYWGNLKNLQKHFKQTQIISVSRYTKFWHGKFCSKLFPSAELLKNFKAGRITQAEYTEIFNKYLETLNPQNCYNALNNCVLVCYEKSGFCHRHIIAEWLNRHGFNCAEF